MSLDAVVNDETGGWERAETPQDLRQLLAELHWAERAAAIERLRAAVAAADTAGLPAQAALFRYMQQVAEDVQRSADVADQGGADTLLAQAWRVAPAALDVFFLLRKHPAAITKELFARGRQLFFGPGAAMRDAEKAACVLAVIGVMLQDPEYGAQAHLLWQGTLQHDGDLAGAARHLARARQLAEMAENSATIAGADLAMAGLRERMGDLAAAAGAYENGLEANKQAGLTLQSLPILERLADVYRQLGWPERALARLDQAIPLIRSLGDEHKLLDALNFRGQLIEDTGDYLTGGEVFESVATAAAAAGLLDIEFQAATNAAMSMLKRQRRNEAIDRYRRVLVRARSSGRQNLIAAAQNNLGQALLNAGRAADAAQQFGPAFFYGVSSQDNRLAAFAAIGLSDADARLGDAGNARTAHSLAAMYALQSGDDSLFTLWVTRLPSHEPDPRASLPALRDAWSRARQSGSLQDESLIMLTLVNVLKRTGAFAEAEAVCAESLQAALAADAQSPWRLRLSKEMADLVSRDPARSAEAYQLVEEGSQLVEQRMRNARSDQARSEIVADQTGLLGLKINLLCKHGLELKESGLLTADVHPGTMAFASHQMAKAPFLVSILARSRFEPPAQVNAELREEEARLLAARAQLDDPDTARHGLATGTDQRGEIRAQLDTCWRRMEPVAPGYVAQRRGLPASAAEVAGLLERVDPSAALVSFFADDRQTTCFVIRAGDQEPSVSTIEMGRPEIESVVRQIRRAFNGSPDEFPPYPPIRGTRPWTRPLTMLENLSDRLLSSFLPVVDGAEVLCIAPHGPLHLLPWAALRAPAGHYLAEQFGVTVTPTATMLRYLADDQRRPGRPAPRPGGWGRRSRGSPPRLFRD